MTTPLSNMVWDGYATPAEHLNPDHAEVARRIIDGGPDD
jgi:hypothetical protein